MQKCVCFLFFFKFGLAHSVPCSPVKITTDKEQYYFCLSFPIQCLFRVAFKPFLMMLSAKSKSYYLMSYFFIKISSYLFVEIKVYVTVH